jgi:HSP20 family protein
MARTRDPFGNLERMRREMGELFEDVWTRTGLSARQRPGFRPAVDVYYCGDPPQAVIKVDLAGVAIEDVNLDIDGRTLVISGMRRPRDAEGRVYEQIEIEHGTFAREIQLRADVDADRAQATYSAGILRVALPIARPEDRSTRVPISSEGRGEEEEER